MLLDEKIESWSELTERWPSDQSGILQSLTELKDAALSLKDARLELVSRPGISISLRFSLEPAPEGRTRPVFHLIDVIAFEDELFLSACFYGDEITDPQELGNLVLGGLFNENGYCFDLDEPDPELSAYLTKRQAEAHQAAAK